MALPKVAPRVSLAWIQADLLSIRESLRVRGGKFFGRPIGLGAVIIFCAYFYVYRAAGNLKARVEKDYNAAQATTKYSEDYKNLKARLDGLLTRLPMTEDPGNWLLQAVRKSLREEGIVPLSTSAAKETVTESYRFISIDVDCQASYQQIGSWISRLERGAELLFIQTMRMTKDNDPIGVNTVKVTITTLAVKRK